jgi:protocatechuate 3,4-dioxygenase beta subunit
MSLSRRDVLKRGSVGLAVAGVSQWLLQACAAPTEASGGLGGYKAYAIAAGAPPGTRPAPAGEKAWAPAEDNILGPYFREGSPFRAKVTPPLEPGRVLLIRGRVWGFDTKRPLAGAMLDVWQANAKGRYDNDDPANPPRKGVYVNRARLITDEEGYYEFESIYPGKYKNDETTFRPAHIHYLVRMNGYRQLVTQLYFKGDPDNATDPFIKPSLIIDLQDKKVEGGAYQEGVFDIVLAKE